MKLSIVVPFKDPDPVHFSEMLAGISAADFSIFSFVELVLVNDGGTERCQQEIADFSRISPTLPVRLIELPINRGVSHARNIGMAESQGDWIALHDADDISMPDRFVKSALFLQQNPELIAVAGDLQVFNEHDNVLFMRLFPPDHDDICVDNLFYCAMAQTALMVNRALWSKSRVQYTDKMDMAQDWDFMIRLGHHGKLANLAIPLVRYRQHPKQRSSAISGEAANSHVRGIWARQLGYLGADIDPALLQVHGHLSPYWLWQISDIEQAWALSPRDVDRWCQHLISKNRISQYVDQAILGHKISRLKRHWQAWINSGDPATQIQSLF
ncbi:glycosyltransferase [Sphaerotilus sp.]|uniref:glycosyltransferase n=1 Tax=Sphaerotilus sp. TaxID=2093942 RepID=UPI00286E662B|nr:glycosyltransferase [Sphaerotilus sp.]